MKIPFWLHGRHAYKQLQTIENRRFVCGFCGDRVSSDRGYGVHQHKDASGSQVNSAGVYVCPHCEGPNFFPPEGDQLPRAPLGRAVSEVPDALNGLYEEARRCTTLEAHTAAVLACRKILMHIAVDRGATEGLRFIEYVNYLANNGFVPPDGKGWVNHIRERGNEANHEITLMSREDADDLLTFSEMLLRFIYEFPARIRKDNAASISE